MVQPSPGFLQAFPTHGSGSPPWLRQADPHTRFDHRPHIDLLGPEKTCTSCHALGDQGSAIGPDLTKTTIHKDAAWMINHFKNPANVRPGSSMPPIQLTDAQLNSLAAFLLKLNDRNASALEDAPEFATQGSLLYQANHCGACHMVNGSGMKVAPALNGLARRQSRSWVIGHFEDPQKLAPGTIMPPYKLPQKDLETLTTYLFALPESQ